MLRRCSFKPLTPRAVINTHPWVAEQVSSQNDVTRRDTRTTRSPEWSLQVHSCLSEQFGQGLGSQHLSRRIQETSEWHVDGTGEMAWQRVCGDGTREKRIYKVD